MHDMVGPVLNWVL